MKLVFNAEVGCPFYKDGCIIYEDRPLFCMSYPFYNTEPETIGEMLRYMKCYKNCFLNYLDPNSTIEYDYEALARQELSLELSTRYVKRKFRYRDIKGIWVKDNIDQAIEDINKKLSFRSIENRCKKLIELNGMRRKIDEECFRISGQKKQ